MPAFQPYWGKPAVRNDRGDGGNVGIIRSPLRATVPPDCGGRSAMIVPTATTDVRIVSIMSLLGVHGFSEILSVRDGPRAARGHDRSHGHRGGCIRRPV